MRFELSNPRTDKRWIFPFFGPENSPIILSPCTCWERMHWGLTNAWFLEFPSAHEPQPKSFCSACWEQSHQEFSRQATNLKSQEQKDASKIKFCNRGGTHHPCPAGGNNRDVLLLRFFLLFIY